MSKERVFRKGDEDVADAMNYYLTYLNYGNVNSWCTDLSLNYYLSNNFCIGAKCSYLNFDITDRNNLDNDTNGDGVVTPAESSLNAPKHRYTSTSQLATCST